MSTPSDLMGRSGTPRDRRNKRATLAWSILLAAATVGASLHLKTATATMPAMKVVVVAVPIALMIPWLRSILRFLRETDELVRQVHMEGIAIGFWAAFAVGFGYVILDGAGLPQPRPSLVVAILTAIMMCGFAIGTVRASKRYR